MCTDIKDSHVFTLSVSVQCAPVHLHQVLCTSGFTPFAGKPVPQPPFHSLLYVCIQNMYIDVRTDTYIYIQLLSFKHSHLQVQHRAVQSRPSDPGWAPNSAGFPVRKRTLSPFSWRVAMATSHKDISIPGQPRLQTDIACWCSHHAPFGQRDGYDLDQPLAGSKAMLLPQPQGILGDVHKHVL